MKYIITGHKGLIGTFLLERLKKEKEYGEPVLAIDLRDENSQDICDIDKINFDNVDLNNIDLLIHLAAFCKINKTIENPENAFKNNVLGTYKVLEFCRKHKIKKIVYTSSSRVLKSERNPYTASKRYGEELIKAYCQCYGIDYVIIRPSTVYGPDPDKTSRVMSKFIKAALKDEELKIFGNEEKTLDFTYVEDFVNGFMLAIKEKNKEFDIASGKGTKLNYVADIITKHVGKGGKGFYEPEIAQPQQVELDISKIKELGFEPKTSIEEGIKKNIRWYLQHPESEW